ncbi:MAG TPA: molybdopterin oxidoreductase, partial [Eubacteriaceae bacterium]|nr:molybdopterin oxidoreductase [Eubacteriaceae bacterium]
DVTIYDAMPEMGGMLRYGIPEYRLPNDVVAQEVAIIEKMGAKMVNNVKVGKDISFDHLRDSYDAMYIAIGAWTSSSMRCPGEDSEAVMGGIEFLRRVTQNEPLEIGNRVAVVGGGNTAMDACRTAVRLGAKEVYILYRRTKDEMPADQVEIVEAEEEGVIFKFLVSPTEIISENGKARVKLQKMELGEPDESGRRRPQPIEGEIEELELDLVIGAIGQGVDRSGFEAIEATKWGTIVADESTFLTNIEGVFAGGDAINEGAGIAIEAIGDAKKASKIINTYLKGDLVPYKEEYLVTRDHEITAEHFKDEEKQKRSPMKHLSPEDRKTNFEEVVKGFTVEQAMADAQRCLECGCGDLYECKLIEYSNQYDVEPELYEGEMHKREYDDGHPYIVRNSDKCILCGLCVRVCDEVMDNGALGLVDRGFDTAVKPAMDYDLNETVCISCGQCVNVCPVGALQERLKMDKPVPVRQEETKTICSFCSVGCNINVQTKGDRIYRVLPDKESEVDGGLLCAKGRFGYDATNQKTRLKTPLVRVEGELVEATWEEALRRTAKAMQSIRTLHGKDAVAASVSDKFTNEEIFLAKQIVEKYLNSDNITSFNRKYSGIKDVLGYDASTNTFDELKATEMIWVIGADLMHDHTIAALKVRDAIKSGVKMALVNDKETDIDDWADYKVIGEQNTEFLKGVLKALLENGKVTERAEDIEKQVKDVTVSDQAKTLAEMYGNAKKAMIVFDQNTVSEEGAKIIAVIAAATGHIGKARDGIIQLKPKNNSQGLADMGIDQNNASVAKAIEDQTVKGMMIFGEDLELKGLDDLEFLMVQDLYLTDTAKKADVVLPAVSFAESVGTYTSAERRVQGIRSAIPALSGKANWEALNELTAALGNKKPYETVRQVTETLSKSVEEYKNVYLQEQACIWPVGKADVLYVEGFATDDQSWVLPAFEDGPLFDKWTPTDYVERAFEKIRIEQL